MFVRVCDKLIAAGADVNCQNDAGESPLHYACLEGREFAVAYLLEKNADVNIKNR